MQLTLEALNKALAPIEDLGHAETTFEVNGVMLTLRLLSPEQEVDVQRYAREAFINNEDDTSAGQNYIERLRLAVLSHAVVAIGDQDFRDVQYVETGDKLENGVAVKKPLATVIRELILKQRWPSDVRMRMFAKYGDLIRISEKTAEAAIEYEPSDVDAEIERLKARILQLESEKENKKQENTNSVAEMAKAVIADDRVANADASLDKMRVSRVEPPVSDPAQVTTPAAPTAAPAAVRQSKVPTSAAPPVEQQRAASQPVEPVQPEQREDTPPIRDSSSFFDPDDADSSDAAIHRENMRMLAARQGRPLPEPPSALSMPRRAPHANAKEVAEEVFQKDGNVFRREPEVLGTRQPDNTQQRVPINAPQKNVRNPRFQAPPRR